VGIWQARSARRPASLAAIRARESSALDALRRAANHGAAARAQSLKMLDVGGASGENKDPDDPWDTLHPPCRGLPTCSSSTSSPAVTPSSHTLRALCPRDARCLYAYTDALRQVKEHQRSLQQKVRADKQHKGLSLPQQYARIMQNQGYFAPWSRVNSWADRVAINNIRKSNTPTALASKEAAIARENAKFARKFRGPHTSQYTGVHLSQDQSLDPKYDPWSNAASREAYYTGY